MIKTTMAFKHLPPTYAAPLPSEEELLSTVREEEKNLRSGNGEGETSEETPTETPIPETVEEDELITWDDQSAKAGGDGQSNGDPDWTKDADNIELPF